MGLIVKLVILGVVFAAGAVTYDKYCDTDGGSGGNATAGGEEGGDERQSCFKRAMAKMSGAAEDKARDGARKARDSLEDRAGMTDPEPSGGNATASPTPASPTSPPSPTPQ